MKLLFDQNPFPKLVSFLPDYSRQRLFTLLDQPDLFGGRRQYFAEKHGVVRSAIPGGR